MLSYTNKEVYDVLEHYPKLVTNDKKQVTKVKSVLDEISEDVIFYLLSKGVPKNRVDNVLSYVFSKKNDSKEIKLIYESEKTIFRNVNNKCSICGSSDNLEIHHIKKSQYYPELRYSSDNWMVLCSKCHKDLHSKEVRVKEELF